jgi:hypothetical protein
MPRFAPAHVAGEDPTELLDMSRWSAMMDGATWERLLSRRVKKEHVRVIRKCTERGWPLAGDSALSKFEKALGRRIRPLRRGRPAKKNESNT